MSASLHSLADLKKMSAEKLQTLIATNVRELAHLSLQVKLNQRKDSHIIKKLKIQVAQAKTLLNTAMSSNNESDAK